VTVAALTKVLLFSFIPDFVSGETLRRIRGTLAVQATIAGNYNGAVGAYVAGINAVAAGVGSLIDPVTDVDDDAWVWYQSFAGFGAGDGQAGALGGQMFPIDNKAMRRVETGYTLVFVAANANAVVGLNVALSFRVLGSEAS